MAVKSLYFVILLCLALHLGSSLADCPNECSHRGKCHPVKKICMCNNGFYTEDCSKSPYDLFYGPWMAFRVFTTVGYFALMILAGVILIVRRRKNVNVNSVATLGFFNAHTIVLALVFIICLDVGLLFAIDPSALLHIFPFPLFRYMFGIVFPLMSTLYCVILFLWVDVYDTTMKTLTKEEAIRKINSNYTKETSLEEILQKTGRIQGVVHRFKMVIVALNVGAWIYQIIREALLSSRVVTTQVWQIQALWLAYFGFVYLVETIGFFYYSPKLLSIMPDSIRPKMMRVTTIIRVQAIAFMVCWAVVAGLFSNKPVNAGIYTLVEFIYRFIVWVILFIILSLFLRFHKNFPFVHIRDAQSKKSSRSQSSWSEKQSERQTSQSADVELAVHGEVVI